MEGLSRRSRDTSPDSAKICRVQQKVKPLKKVQVVYYLSRNGLLEHPHYMEITLSPNQPLRLKDVLDRLIALRGSGMPLLYSWSCKRSYKSGYVWYDLSADDVIHPAEGAEYVLKGSQLLQPCSERFQQLHVSSRQISNQDPNSESKRKTMMKYSCSPQREAEEFEEYEEQDEDYEDYAEKTCYTSSTTSTTPHSRCSRGVSTDELDEEHDNIGPQNQVVNNVNPTTKVTVEESLSLPAPPPPLTDSNNSASKRFQDGDSVSGLAPSRNSVLLQLIACGSSAVCKAKNAPCMSNVMRKSAGNSNGNNVNRNAKLSVSEVDMIKYISENPRFGNLQSEEKEYFSGSLVESINEERAVSQLQPVLNKSSSYNERRSSIKDVGIDEVKEEAETEKKGSGVKGKCIPRKKSCALESKKSTRK
ncbi:hypothetical protein L6164_012359 [Bauhinia variegata]|uniref:Uncharacterized protein n=1 Tax=Bauhinia variegata TaxID=167791 RepID=A0ACB9P9Q4_BAUVA|nr:hypothetical protein L6164_012359 [Bauhinia variegata]